MNVLIESLTLENRENYDRLLRYLMNYAMFEYHIGVEFTNRLPVYAPSVSYNEPGKLIIMNANWYHPIEIPFLLAHEIGHVLYEDQQYYNLNDQTVNHGEADANIFAINLLRKYCDDNEFHFDSYYKFAKAFCIPHDLYYLFTDGRIVQSQ